LFIEVRLAANASTRTIPTSDAMPIVLFISLLILLGIYEMLRIDSIELMDDRLSFFK